MKHTATLKLAFALACAIGSGAALAIRRHRVLAIHFVYLNNAFPEYLCLFSVRRWTNCAAITGC